MNIAFRESRKLLAVLLAYGLVLALGYAVGWDSAVGFSQRELNLDMHYRNMTYGRDVLLVLGVLSLTGITAGNYIIRSFANRRDLVVVGRLTLTCAVFLLGITAGHLTLFIPWLNAR
ncbi:MAG TPA: hypothetical protein VJ843_03720 [Candidatus Saccharimonadales bacterium]|nr:hypothetical protein [Candidatus Saccharimonadales bacterium]